ncbi:DUF1048 domain-containing protein [Arthrobacter sp. Soc17.1.1.1]|uniref:DUF1048 domain-containing protein n=1 Tax=Arthrobacter sp. Soc17.1.1.1 TaxID=3121277 RepID=UPI002FE4CF93
MWIEKIVGDLGDKKRYREYRERVRRLPDGYREAALALERYLLHLGPSNDGNSLIAMVTDLADLFEQSVAAGTPLRDVVGTDPVEFAEEFMQNYGGGSWIRTERDRLAKAIDHAEAEERR